MKYIIYSIWLVFLISYQLQAQKITEIRADLDKSKRIIILTYNLLAEYKLQEKQKFDIQVFVSLDSGKTYSPPLEYVSGNITKISPNINNKIIWTYYAEANLSQFKSDKILFKLVGNLNQTEEDNRILKLGNTNSIWQSLVLPGWGSSQVQGTKTKWWLGASAYVLMGSGIYFKLNADKLYQDYQGFQTPEAAKNTFDKARQQQTISQIFLIGGGAIWLGDMVYTFIKGSQNDKLQKEILSRKRSVNAQWHGTGGSLIWKF